MKSIYAATALCQESLCKEHSLNELLFHFFFPSFPDSLGVDCCLCVPWLMSEVEYWEV